MKIKGMFMLLLTAAMIACPVACVKDTNQCNDNTSSNDCTVPDTNSGDTGTAV